MTACRVSKLETTDIFSLGELYVSDFVPMDYAEERKKAELTLCFGEEAGLLQLKSSVPLDEMYDKYWYRSGTNASMKNALQDVVTSVQDRIHLNDGDAWLDIASNDGTLLSFVPKDIIRIGIDPADDTFVKEAVKVTDDVIQDYFSVSAYRSGQYGYMKAKVITIIAMFYDLDDPASFLQDIDSVMDDDGLLVIQMSYTPLMLRQLAFDNICHEHLCYHSVTSMKYLLTECGFRIVDCELNDVNGGSFRLYIRKSSSDISKYRTAPFRDVCNYRVKSLLDYENACGYHSSHVFRTFHKNIQQLRIQIVDFIQTEIKKGKKIWGYGASTKGNTLLQYFGIDSTMIEGIAERSPYKYGLKTIGTNIPIYPEDEMRKANPDYLLILPWHFVSEFRIREKDFLVNGGKFIVPCPKFEIIGA